MLGISFIIICLCVVSCVRKANKRIRLCEKGFHTFPLSHTNCTVMPRPFSPHSFQFWHLSRSRVSSSLLIMRGQLINSHGLTPHNNRISFISYTFAICNWKRLIVFRFCSINCQHFPTILNDLINICLIYYISDWFGNHLMSDRSYLTS